MIDFSGKKITVMGLGLLGRGVGVVKFLVGKGAMVTVTDLKTAKELKSSIDEIEKFYKRSKRYTKYQIQNIRYKIQPIKFVLGKHRLEDFKNADMVFKAAGVPLDSPFIAEAKKNHVPIFMDDALFAREAECEIIGVTGTRGKTTTSNLIYEIAKATGKKVYPHTNKEVEANFFVGEVGVNNKADEVNYKADIGVGVYLAGNIKGTATLPLLDKVKKNDLAVLELSSWQLQGWRDLKISPHIAVVTNIYPDHMNYYKNSMAAYVHDKEAIFANQTKKDYLVLNKNCAWCKKMAKKARGKVVWFSANDIPRGWNLKIFGEHNLENIAAALTVGKILGLPPAKIKKTVESFGAVPGRLEFVRKVGGVEFYNDTTATMPEATIAALKALKDKKIVLIAGGADKNLDFRDLAPVVKKYAKAVVLLNGTATPKLQKQLLITNYQLPGTIARSMREAVATARKLAARGDIILLSPAAASFGMFKNEFDRGDQFLKEVKKI